MPRLVYSTICSVDGYSADSDGDFSWSAPGPAVHSAVNDLLRPMGTMLFGRRMYDVLSAWETMGTEAHQPAEIRDFARLWRGADKVVYSATRTTVDSARTRLEPVFDPGVVAALKDASASDLSIGGPTLAASALAAGLVDEVDLFVVPVSVGGGLPALPRGGRHGLRLLEEHRFADGVVHLRYAVTT